MRRRTPRRDRAKGAFGSAAVQWAKCREKAHAPPMGWIPMIWLRRPRYHLRLYPTWLSFAPANRTRPDRLVAHDPDLSPLDLIVAPNGNIVVSSERPFGAPDAVTTVRDMIPKAGSSSA